MSRKTSYVGGLPESEWRSPTTMLCLQEGHLWVLQVRTGKKGTYLRGRAERQLTGYRADRRSSDLATDVRVDEFKERRLL